MSDDFFNLVDLKVGEQGLQCNPDEMIDVPASLLIELSKIFERDDIVTKMGHCFDMHPGQINWLCTVISQVTDELEQRYEKPIANRNRRRSRNRLI